MAKVLVWPKEPITNYSVEIKWMGWGMWAATLSYTTSGRRHQHKIKFKSGYDAYEFKKRIIADLEAMESGKGA